MPSSRAVSRIRNTAGWGVHSNVNAQTHRLSYGGGIGGYRGQLLTPPDHTPSLSSSDSTRCHKRPLSLCLHPPPSRLPPQLPLLPSHPLPHLPPNRRTRGSRRTLRMDTLLTTGSPPAPLPSRAAAARARRWWRRRPANDMLFVVCAGDHVELKFLSPTSSSGCGCKRRSRRRRGGCGGEGKYEGRWWKDDPSAPAAQGVPGVRELYAEALENDAGVLSSPCITSTATSPPPPSPGASSACALRGCMGNEYLNE
ncbi:hypothetical protein B0H16DRAFT_132273 [Mycena metata]|uniref:Uncharacterized protein n=1 Tax=Mycena metata TaxID=1033252 RepID=A0AAD7MWH4_9AGAR|nr:hypothetical protein B0H16DRAFT_132273 [Mycena metata]